MSNADNPRRSATRGDAALQSWLRQSLHESYGAVVNEAVPEELLRLVQARQPGPDCRPTEMERRRSDGD